jgi:uncharacterized 2Fe-2S/4Fe-4S cluster protein (DUF4445 family)
MREREIPVTFQPSGKTVYVLPGTRVVEAAALAALAFDSPCGGEGTCGKCRIAVRKGAGDPSSIERNRFAPDELAAGVRLACQTAVRGPATIEIPETSLLGSSCKILIDGESSGYAVEPVVRKRYVELPRPERGCDEPDQTRLERAIGPVELDLAMLRLLPRRLRDAAFAGTAVVAEGRLLDFEPGDTRRRAAAVAVDIGTTTVVAMLLDLNTGGELAVAARLNPQTSFGDDVLSRILHAGSESDGLAQLRDAIVRAVDAMIGQLVDRAGLQRSDVYEVVLAGNTTMQHLFCGVDPRALGEVPFVPVAARRVSAPADGLGLCIHPRGRAYVFPVIGGFVGGDTVAGILATRLLDAKLPTLLVDIGTNGEIVLCAGGKLVAASTAAGPAFEGARIACGMRAGAGAVEKVAVEDGRLHINVIDDAPAVGLCGSALIDLTAELLRHGVLTREGRLPPPDALPEHVADDLRRRVVLRDGKTEFVLVDADASGTGRPIKLSQRDFRELQLASGAIRAGIDLLLKREGIPPADLDAVLLAGGFGNFIRRRNAQRIGLLPTGLPRHRIRFQGNTSLSGARMAAVSSQSRNQADGIAAQTQHVDLSADPDFRWAFAEAMIFPSDGE